MALVRTFWMRVLAPGASSLPVSCVTISRIYREEYACVNL
jgi:hypothetical protein